MAHIYIWKREQPLLTGEPKGAAMSKRSKVKKVEKAAKKLQHPTDVESWEEFESPAAATDNAVAHAHDDPDDAALSDDVARIRAENPGIGSFAAHVQAAHQTGTVQKNDDPVGPLADALVDLQREARREGMTLSQRLVLNKASREAELKYLRHVRPWDVPDEAQLHKAETDSALVAKAEAIRRADPRLTRTEAMRRAARKAA